MGLSTMKLQDFPVEVLRLILNGQNSWAAIELWKAGSTILNKKLAGKGVTEVDIMDTEADSTSRWPQCLKEFQLTRLRVIRPAAWLAEPLALRGHLQKLSPTLRSLEIRAGGLDKTFFSFKPPNEAINSGDDTSPKRPAKRSKSKEHPDADQSHVEMWNMAESFPLLEHLSLSREVGTDRGIFPSSSDSKLFSLLPRTLTSFEYPYSFGGKLDDLSALPPGLRTIRLPAQSVSEAGLLTLPKSITELGESLEYTQALPRLVREPGILPLLEDTGMTEVELDMAELCDLIFNKGHHLPPTFEIRMDDHPRLFDVLPQNLRKLILMGDDVVTLLPPQTSLLPRGLTSLEVSIIQWTGIEVDTWPSTLTKLICSESISFGAHCFSLLPRSLKIFKIGDDGAAPASNPADAALCEDLTALRTIGKESLRLEKDRWSIEKAKLLRRGAEKYVQEIEDGGLLGLPLGLTRLDILSTEYAVSRKLIMPPNLRAIQWKTNVVRVDDARLLGGFSPLSTTLELQIGVGPPRCAPGQTTLRLPSQCLLYRAPITSLHILFHSKLFERSAFKYLPRTLLHLHFGGPSFIFTEELLDLPENLQSLSFSCLFDNPLASWPSLLPRGLTSLSVSSPILGAEIVNLPQSLTSIAATFGNTSLAHVRQFPRGLRTLSVYAADDLLHAERNRYLHLESFQTLIATYRPFWRIWETDEADMALEIELASPHTPSLVENFTPSLDETYRPFSFSAGADDHADEDDGDVYLTSVMDVDVAVPEKVVDKDTDVDKDLPRKRFTERLQPPSAVARSRARVRKVHKTKALDNIDARTIRRLTPRA